LNPAGDGQLRALRVRNRLRVIRQLREQGKASQAEIARQTGLSRTTIRLQDAGVEATERSRLNQ
jgi:DNA-binding XRE family transcriptional regulator